MTEAFRRIAELEERVDLLETPLWKRLAFYLNGWPRLPVTADRQAWRFWHRFAIVDRLGRARLLGRTDR